MAGTFNAQNVANALWAYATMGREPEVAVMQELAGRAQAVAGTFKAQEVANTLCGQRACFLFFAPLTQKFDGLIPWCSTWCDWTRLIFSSDTERYWVLQCENEVSCLSLPVVHH